MHKPQPSLAMRDEIPHGYRTYTGQVPAHGEIDRYNAIQRRINSFHAAGREAPQELYNASHAAFELMSTPDCCRTCGQPAKVNHGHQCSHCAASWHERVQATRGEVE